jgi:hypothetical protein
LNNRGANEQRAAPRGAATQGAAATAPEEPVIPDLQRGATDHDGWPVG